MDTDKVYSIKESRLYPIVILERLFSHKLRHTLYELTMSIILICVLFIGMSYALQYVKGEGIDITEKIIDPVNIFTPIVMGVTFILLSIWMVIYSLEAYFRALYFKENEFNPRASDISSADLFSFQVLRILTKNDSPDITNSFLSSKQGIKIMMRCGITRDKLTEYLSNRSRDNLYPFPQIAEYELFTLQNLVQYIFDLDAEFSEFLFSNGVLLQHLQGSASWVVQGNEEAKNKERWWTKENLEKIGGLGADFAYGEAYILKRYSNEIYGSKAAADYAFSTEKNEGDLSELKSVLSRSRESNAILVGEQGGGKMSLLYAFASDLFHGKVPANLESKKLILFNSSTLIASSREKGELESSLLRAMNDAVYAGNIIIVFDDFPAFMQSASMLGVDIIKLLDPYFNSAGIQIIILSGLDEYHQNLEQNVQIMGRFERILVKEPDEDESIIVLQHVAQELEKRYNVIFTYISILEIIEGVKNYFQDPVMPDKAIDIATELPDRVKSQNRNIITKQDVLKLITNKTNIPTGEIQDDERGKLLNLESLLHDRVIGQEEAVNAVSSSMRRSRSGVRNMSRPIGSFLFIGPTGVGKTETAKTLAEVFFGDENQMQRIDMSEYRGADALDRLIGSQTTGQVGTLTKLIKEQPYSVLLLDEFEKTNPNIHDLFLQILDEGYYSDMHGKKVNARNIIFIATSNAGSDLIWEYMEKGIKLVNAQREVVNHLVETGIFKPEFLNRFDAVVLFHPLELKHIEQIAEIMLGGLAKRLRKKGLDFRFTHELVEYNALSGYDRTFGARPLTRYIQENIEQIIADKIIKGEILTGSHFTLTPEDLVGTPTQQNNTANTVLPTTSPVAQQTQQQFPRQRTDALTPPWQEEIPSEIIEVSTSPQLDNIINQAQVQNVASMTNTQRQTPNLDMLPVNGAQQQNKTNLVQEQQVIPPLTTQPKIKKPIELATIKHRGPQFEKKDIPNQT